MRKKIIFLIASFFYCSFLTVWQNEFLIAQNEQFDWHVWFCSFYSFRKCHEKENRGKKSADFCSCCCQFFKCFWWLRLDQNALSVCFCFFFLGFHFFKAFFSTTWAAQLSSVGFVNLLFGDEFNQQNLKKIEYLKFRAKNNVSMKIQVMHSSKKPLKT